MQLRFAFLTYLSRSGSTYLARCLNELNDVCVVLECFLPAELFGIKGYQIPSFNNSSEVCAYINQIIPFTKLDTWKLDLGDEQNYAALSYPIDGKILVETLLTLYAKAHKPDAKVIIYKGAPINPWKSVEVAVSFEDWFFLHIVRDPRSVYLSQSRIFNQEERRPFAINAYEVAYDWKKAVSFFSLLPKSASYELTYENLITRNDEVISDLASFLEVGSSRDSKHLEYYLDLIPKKERGIHSNLKKRPKNDRIDAWKSEMSDADVAVIQHKLRLEMDSRGYNMKPVNRHAIYFVSQKLGYHFLIKLYTIKRIIGRATGNPKYFLKKILLRIHR